MRIPLRWCATALFLSLCALPALAQETTGRLEGRALDAKGQPIAEVNVAVTSPALQGQRGCLTTAKGTFVLQSLPVGEYRVTVAHLSYQKQVLESVPVRLGQNTLLGDLRLKEAVYGQPEVEVSAKAPLIDTRSTEVGGVLAASDYRALPIQRDYRSVVALLPQVNESPYGDPVNFAGSTGYENRYFIDGIDVTEPYRNSSGTRLPYNFVRELRVRAGGYEAEYRSSLGGEIEAVTYSGGNDLTSEVFGFYTSSGMSGDPRQGAADPNTGDMASYDVGVGIGGPLKKDRLWYYLAYNPTFEREHVEIPGQGMFTDNAMTHSFAGKVTWKLNPNNSLVVTTLGDPWTREAVAAPYAIYTGQPVSFLNPDPDLMSLGGGTVSLAAEDQHLVHDNLMLKGAVSRSWFRDRNVPRTPRGDAEMLFVDSRTGTWSGGAQDRIDNRSATTTARLNCTWQKGDHEVKGGVEYKDAHVNYEQYSAFVQELSDSSYFHWIGEVTGTVANRTPSAYLQDSWRLASSIHINAGLRWDGLYIVASDGSVAQTILDQWQPRLGVVWLPGSSGVQKVSASLGRFYQDLALYPLFAYYNTGTRWDFMYYDHDPRVDPTRGDTLRAPGRIQQRIAGLEGQYFDEITLGYERSVRGDGRLGVRGMFRVLRQALEDGFSISEFAFGNPGSGELSEYPRAKREYSSLELSYKQGLGGRASMLLSYVLSRAHGNHPGLFNPDFGPNVPNANGSFDWPEMLVNGTGLLPGDRTHVFKLSGSYRAGAGVTVGVAGAVRSGTPLSEYGGSSVGFPWTDFMRQRGTAGRTPAIWDLNLRIAYEPHLLAAGVSQPRFTVDLLHVASQREAVRYDQTHFFNIDADGNQINPNPAYGLPTSFQSPMSVRVGAELSF